MNRLIQYFLLIAALILFDQVSKSWLISYLKTQPNFILQLLPFLDFVYAWNYGISFGLFRQYHQYSNYILLFLNSFIVIYLLILLSRPGSRLCRCGLIFITGGALGNLADRAFRGAVFDFIYFNYGNIDFPAFNLADSFITIGATLFIYGYFLRKKNP